MKNILSIIVNNSYGVLSHVAGLFARRGYNIDSLSVGETDSADKSVITLVANENEEVVLQIKKQLYKLIDVISVDHIPQQNSIQRELILVSINLLKQNRSQVVNLVQAYQAQILEMNINNVIILLNGSPTTISSFITIMKEFGIVKIARTGTIALSQLSSS